MKLSIEAGQQFDAAEKAYSALHECVIKWQGENHPALAAWTPPSGKPSFTLGDLPEEPVLELWQRLNEQAGLNLTRAALALELSAFKEGQQPSDREMLTRLFLAFSGVAGWLRQRLAPEVLPTPPEDRPPTMCPVCGEETRLSILVPPVGKRELFCRLCGHTWPVKRIGCSVCGSENVSSQTYLQAPEFPGVQMAVCGDCGEYFKEIDLRTHQADDPVWEDIRTLPLNYAAEQWLNKPSNQRETLPS